MPGGFEGKISGLIVERTGIVPEPVYVSALNGASSLTTAASNSPATLSAFDTKRIAPGAPFPAKKELQPVLSFHRQLSLLNGRQ